MRPESSSPTSDVEPVRQWAIRVWDLPTRIFHWLMAALVVTSFATGKTGGNWMSLHMLSGYALLSLLLFRLAWGAIGGRYARFASFVRSPSAVWRYWTDLIRDRAPRYLGHNPMGGWSVVAMLAALMLQAVTGLFSTDDIFTEGPLYPLVSKAASDGLTRIHLLNQNIIVILVALHLAAVLFYWIVKKDNLIVPMITGVKAWHQEAPPSGGNLWAAAAAMIAAAACVYFTVG
jgi:cytochrome b